MTRSAPLLLILSACAPLPEEFATLYTGSWCATFTDQCDGAEPEVCRDVGREVAGLPPRVDCTYHAETARLCLASPAWRCEDDEVTPPPLCEGVWTCPADP